MIKKGLIICFLCLVFSISAFSQEILRGLQVNPVVRAAFVKSSVSRSFIGTDTIPLNMPFFDDFSTPDIFPSPDRWVDRYTYQNTDIPVFPVNTGAITLDAINDSGMIYPDAIPGPATFIADYLTSRYIRLDSVFSPSPRKLNPSDSVFLSFYYQPQGRGLPPETNDSLILQFLVRPAFDSITPTDTIPYPETWETVWSTPGMSLDTFYLKNKHYFLQVMLPITDGSRFFRKNFRFRFYNRVSLASSAEPSWQSNCDQWNLDNIYLNYERTSTDTLYPEIRFIERVPSLLSFYEAMPYPQYCDDPTNEMADSLSILISNRTNEERNCRYGYTLSNYNGSYHKTYNGGNYGVKPFYTNGYVTYPPFAHPNVSFLFPISQADTASFLVEHHILDNTPGSTLGDTMRRVQKFYNYYAYDDGSADAGYGLTPAGSMLACRFHLNKSPDTLRAVQMFFNHTLSGNSQQLFYLCVWNDNIGKPGDTIYSDLVLPLYADSLNQFFTYHLTRPVRVSGTFYVGWIQTTNDNLNLGFDRYNDNHQENFYNVTGQWNNSAYSGSLMVRPIVGKPIPVGINEKSDQIISLDIYPNPCSGKKIYLKISGDINPKPEMKQFTLSISNLMGQTRLRVPYTPEIDVSFLPSGFYFLRLSDSFGIEKYTTKLIISR